MNDINKKNGPLSEKEISEFLVDGIPGNKPKVEMLLKCLPLNVVASIKTQMVHFINEAPSVSREFPQNHIYFQDSSGLVGLNQSSFPGETESELNLWYEFRKRKALETNPDASLLMFTSNVEATIAVCGEETLLAFIFIIETDGHFFEIIIPTIFRDGKDQRLSFLWKGPKMESLYSGQFPSLLPMNFPEVKDGQGVA